MKIGAISPSARILVVNEDANILNAFKLVLLDEPYEVLTAESGKEALELMARDNKVAVIVSDQRMSKMDGTAFLEKAKIMAPDASRLVLAECADIPAVINSVSKGNVYRYIAKPWNDQELISIIREADSRYALLQKNKRLTEIVRQQNAELKQGSSQPRYDVQKQAIEPQSNNDELRIINERLRKNFRDSIEAFAGLIELRDRKSMSHSRNVAEIAVQTARNFGMPSDEIEIIHTASLVHDIGKIGMPDALLVTSFETMTKEEQQEYLQHPVRGQAAIDSIEDLRQAGTLIRSHHESFDGTGFPDRLKGEKIPIGARIIAAADFYDRTFALHQGSNAVDVSWNQLRKEEGKLFDPEVCRLIEKPIRKAYSTKVSKTDMVEVEFSISDISVGMQLAQDVRSGTGLLLLSKGAMLDSQNLPALRRYYQLDPPKGGIYVWSKR